MISSVPLNSQERIVKSPLWSNVFKNWNSQESEKVTALKQVPVFDGLSVLAVTVGLIAAIAIFIGSFATNLADQPGDFSQRLETESFMDDFNGFIDNAKEKLPDFVKGRGDDVDAASKLNEVVGDLMSTLLTFAGILGSFVFNMIW